MRVSAAMPTTVYVRPQSRKVWPIAFSPGHTAFAVFSETMALRGFFAFAVIEVTSGDERNAHSRKVVWADDAPVGNRYLADGQGMIRANQPIDHQIARKRHNAGDAYGLHAGQSA